MTGSASEVFVRTIVSSLRKSNKTEALKDFASMCVALSQRIERLEKRPELKYLGVWNSEHDYPECSAVTFDGSIWIAAISSKGLRPGDGSQAWRLAVKRGRDGRDGKEGK
jgi:hypothetical protein